MLLLLLSTLSLLKSTNQVIMLIFHIQWLSLNALCTNTHRDSWPGVSAMLDRDSILCHVPYGSNWEYSNFGDNQI